MSSITHSVSPKLEAGESHPPLTQQPRIVFQDEDAIHPGRRSHRRGSHQRSASRDSISSVRSRANSTSGIPIEFRTISFQVSESQAIGRTLSKDRKATTKKR